MFFISFSQILPLDEFFYVAKSFQILQTQYKFSMIYFRITENWRFDMILLCMKWFFYNEKLAEFARLARLFHKIMWQFHFVNVESTLITNKYLIIRKDRHICRHLLWILNRYAILLLQVFIFTRAVLTYIFTSAVLKK